MKHILLAVCLFSTVNLLAQGSTGLIAHWDMNGTVSDVSGNGHNGHATSILPTTDRFGFANKAYYFNGSTSVVTAPYMADLNLTNYSLCAIIKVSGFYDGYCQGSFVVCRGRNLQPGSYSIQFTDNFYDGGDCNATDSSAQVFAATAGTTGSGVSGLYLWQYTPHIATGTWYRVVATWDGTQYKIWVNGQLKSTVPNLVTGSSIGSSADSLAIGKHIFSTSSEIFPFHGVIDDVRIYDRVLNDSETIHYGDTCGVITLQPSSTSKLTGGTAVFTAKSSIVGVAYQWQQDIGTGYINLSASGAYSGVTTPTLTVAGVTTALNAAHYRCVVANTWGCADTTAYAVLTVSGVGVNDVVTNEMVSVFPNPVQDKITISLPLHVSNATIEVVDQLGQVVVRQTFSGTSYTTGINELPSGMYTVRVKGNDFVVYKKIVKE